MSLITRRAFAAGLAPAIGAIGGLTGVRIARAQGDGWLMGPDMLARLRGAQKLERLRPLLEDDPGTPAFGPPGGVPVVSFLDYRCPFCREHAPIALRLMEERGDVRLVFKEWPIFKGVSITAARAALAAQRQGGYLAMHTTLMESRFTDQAAIIGLARSAGLDPARLARDMGDPEIDRHLATTGELAAELGLRGTPSLVIGSRIVPGAVGHAGLEALVEQALAGGDRSADGDRERIPGRRDEIPAQSPAYREHDDRQ
jgi:Thioredoxin